MRLGTWCVVVAWMLTNVGIGSRAGAQTLPAPTAPLINRIEDQPLPGASLVRETAAARALELGFPSIAAAMYAQLIAQPDLTSESQARLVLGWTVALLENGRVAEARAALSAYTGPHDAAYRMRIGLAAIAAGDVGAARAAAEGIELEQLAPAERSWLFYLRGLIAEEAGAFPQAVELQSQAMDAAVSHWQRARFSLAWERARLRFQPVTESDVREAARAVERYQGTATGYDHARRYAAILSALGRAGEARNFLQRQLMELPAQERTVQDDFRLLLGLIAGPADGVGRNALSNLLASGSSPEKQRIALQLLAQGASTGTAREAWRAELSRLIAQDPPHPLLPDLLLYRAELALTANDYTEAQQDAQALVAQFPASALRPAALGVLMGAAWERKFYRAVASYANDARRLMSAGDARARVGVLLAEAFFQAGDYRSAADAYGATLMEVPAGVQPGQLMFQQIVSLIRTPDLREASARLDALSRRQDFDIVNRWKAEYNLARALQAADRSEDAAQRLEALLQRRENQSELPPELAVRLAWLRARLALDIGQAERAIELARALTEQLSGFGADLRADLHAEVASSLALVEAEANVALDRQEAAVQVLRRLRTGEYSKTDAAVVSYIVEADAYAKNNQLVEAQRLMTRLADDFPQNLYAPWALYQAAHYAERRGQDNFLEDAIRIIERLVNTYPRSELVFYARFKQGDLLRKLNQVGPALRIYETLANDYAQHQDVYAVELARADCHAAQAASDLSQLESALTIYERLRDIPTAPAEIRIEAGFKYGYGLARRGPVERAHAVWWEVVNTFLLGTERREDPSGRHSYWLAKTLLELGRSLEAASKLEEARNAYRLMIEQGLPGPNLARAELARLSGGAPLEPSR
jgi:cellulose synthase operon protein C